MFKKDIRKSTTRRGLSIMLNPLIIVLFLVSCSNSTEDFMTQYKDKTIIIYLVADNSLQQYSDSLFNDIDIFCQGKELENSNVIVFCDDDKATSLYQATNRGMVKLVDYNNVNSVSPQNVYEILNYICEKYPASETGLILWSHGSGWLPTGNKTRSFGDDEGEAIDINDLSASICKKMDYIIFDACYMGCIEVVTELKEKSDYFVLSPDVVPSEGIVDTVSINTLMGKGGLEDRLIRVSKHYTDDMYRQKQLPIALVKSSEFDGMMQLCNRMTKHDFNDEPSYYKFRANTIFYDLGSLINSGNNSHALEILNKFIVYRPKYISDNACLSIFVPNDNNRNYHEYYSMTKWNEMTNWLCKFGFLN